MQRSLGFFAIAMLLACGGDGSKGPDITQPPQPVPGVLSVLLTTPNGDDRAMVLTVSGPAGTNNVIAGPVAYRVESRITGTTVKVAVFGNITSGTLIRFNVPDVTKLSSYSALVTEVSDPSNSLRSELGGYALSIVQ